MRRKYNIRIRKPVKNYNFPEYPSEITHPNKIVYVNIYVNL